METQTKYLNDQKVLLFVLTGDTRTLPDSVRPMRKPVRKRVLITTVKPDNSPPERFKRSNPANPWIQEHKIRRRDNQERYRTHSHRIQEFAETSGYRVMSNRQKLQPSKFGESPCHRPIEPGERPNVGPQPIKE